MRSQYRTTAAGALLALASATAAAQTPNFIASTYEMVARRESVTFAGFSASRGQAFFESTHGSDWSCATCHTRNPLDAGKHAKTGKPIPPLAPAANAERLSRVEHVEKWFRRNCNDVLGRACTTLEKGDVVAYLTSLRREVSR